MGGCQCNDRYADAPQDLYVYLDCIDGVLGSKKEEIAIGEKA